MATTGTDEVDIQSGDERLIAALARGCTHAAAAAECDISTRTITRRMADPAFKQLVSDARRLLLDQALSAATDALPLAIETLKALMTNSESEVSKLGAARVLVQLLVPLKTAIDIEDRLTALESKQ